MADFPTWRELFAIARNAILAGNPDIRPDVVDTPGTNANILTGMMALVGEQIVRQAAVAMSRAIPSLATGEWLDRLAWDWYGMTRNPATKAQVTLTFSRTDTSQADTIPKGTKVSTEDGSIVFETDDDLNIGAGEASGQITATCVEAGDKGNVLAGTLIKLLSTLPGWSVTNEQQAAGGTDEESDEHLRWRMRNYWAAQQRGTKAAIEYGAKQVPGVAYAVVTESLEGSTLKVTLTIADQTGNASQSMISAVEQELYNWRAAGVTVEVQGGSVQWITIKVKVTVGSGWDTTVIKSAVQKNILNYVNGLGLGEDMRTSGIREAVFKVNQVYPDSIKTCTVEEPTLDYAGQPNIVYRTREDMITVE